MRVRGVEEQVELVLSQFPEVVMELLRLINDECVFLKALCVERGSVLGVDVYGDASFRKGVEELRRDIFEELADALWYLSVLRCRRKGLLREG